jgi:hypothetical protein
VANRVARVQEESAGGGKMSDSLREIERDVADAAFRLISHVSQYIIENPTRAADIATFLAARYALHAHHVNLISTANEIFNLFPVNNGGAV